MKEDLYAWHQWIGYEEGFGPGEVSLISAFGLVDRQNIFGEDEDLWNLMFF